MRILVAAIITAVALLAVGCKHDVNCDCAPADAALYVDLQRPIPVGHQIEVCNADSCISDDPLSRQLDRDGAYIERDQVGAWLSNSGRPLTVTERSPSGKVITSVRVRAEKVGGGCCGTGWVLRP